jgi:hypothetical protein
MNTLHAPNQCDPRAARIAKVKFVVLEWDEEVADPPKAHSPLLTTLRNFLIRVIGRLEAARP